MENSLNVDLNNSNNNYPQIPNRQKFEGFDYLRAIFAIAIVAYKTRVFNIPEILILNEWTSALSGYILSGMFGALAVPVFLNISLFLFYYKSSDLELNYFFKKRLPKLISLYAFWLAAITIFDILFVGNNEIIISLLSSPKVLLEFIISGNNTPYFFFFSLIFLTIIAKILSLVLSIFNSRKTKLYISYFLLFFSCILIFTFSFLEAILNYKGLQGGFAKVLINIIHWDYTPLNFLPYIFTSIITTQEYQEGKLNQISNWLQIKLSILGFLALSFFLLEWILTASKILIQVDQSPLDHYMRLSLVFTSWLVLYLALLWHQQAPKIVELISKCSLGIYVFHVFFIFKGFLDVSFFIPAIPLLKIIANFLIILIGSILLTLIARRTKWLKEFV